MSAVQGITEQTIMKDRASIFNTLVDYSSDAIFVIDLPTGRYVEFNETACQLLGYTREELGGLGVLDVVLHFPDLKQWHQSVDRVRHGKSVLFQSSYRRKDRSCFPVEVNTKFISYRGKEYLVVIARDVTDRIEAERLARATVDALSAHIAILDEAGTIVAVNKSWEEFAIKNAGSLEGKGVGENYLRVCEEARGDCGEEGPLVARGMREVMEGRKKEFLLEYACHSESKERWFLCRVTRFRGHGVTRIVVAHENISKRKKAEIRLSESEQYFRDLVENVNEVFFVVNTRGRVTYASPNVKALTGYEPGETIGKPYLLFTAPRDRGVVRQHIERALADRVEMTRSEFQGQRKDGTTFWVDQSTRIIRDKQGAVVEFANVARDCTDRHLAFEELERERTLLRTLVESIPDEVAVKDTERRFVLANSACVKALKRNHESEIVGKKDEDLILPHFAQEGKSEDEGVLTTGVPMINKMGKDWSPTGLEKPRRVLLSSKIPLVAPKGGVEGLVVINRNITEMMEAEKEIERKNEQLRNIFENLDQVFWSYDIMEQRYIDISHTCERLHGVKVRELMENPGLWFDMVHPEDRQAAMDLTGLDAGKPIVQILRVIRRSDGALRWMQNRIMGVMEEGRLVRMDGALTDITEQKLAELALQESEAKFRELFHEAPVGYHEIDSTGRIVNVNQTQLSMLGYQRHEMIGRFLWEFLLEEDARETILGKLNGTIPVVSVEGTALRKSGTYLPVLADHRYILDAHGTIIGLRGSWQDMSQQKQSRKALLESERRFRALIENTSDQIFLVERTGIIKYTSPSVERVLGYSPEECLGRNVFEFLHRGERKWVRRLFDDILRGERKTIVSVIQVRHKDGGWRSMEMIGTNFLDEPNLQGVVINARDVTARMVAEEQLKFQSDVLQNVRDSIVVTDLQGRIVYWNLGAETVFGYGVEEMMGATLDRIYPYLDPDQVQRDFSKILQGHVYQGEWRGKRKDGCEVWVDVKSTVMKDKEGKIIGFLGVSKDITERKKSEEALRDSEEKYREFFEEDLSGAFISTPEGKILNCNTAYARIFGYGSVEEVLQTDAQEFYLHQKDRERFLSALQARGKLEHFEEDARTKLGNKIHIVENILGKFDGEGNLTEIRGYIIDNTERLRLEEQVRQIQKMDSIGTLAGGIAHDFNNILGIILGYTSIIERTPGVPADLVPSLETINKAVHRGAALVRQLLTFARKNEITVEEVDVNQVTRELGGMLKETFPKTVELNFHLEKELLRIMADRTQLVQALLNLCVNARDAMPKGGILTLTTGRVDGTRLKSSNPEARSIPYAYLRVADTGTGMDRETRERIFEPFFTTKEQGKGTGLGLAVVYGIIKSYDGIVEVESEPGCGTTFHLYFPLATEKSPLRELPEKRTNPMPTGSETILVVEDEEVLVAMVQDLLESRGFKVLVARNGLEAVEVFKANTETIDLVLSDLGLPKLGGFDAFKQIRQIKPGTRFVFASGYLDPAVRSEMLKEGIMQFIQKPYVMEDLLDRVREVLDRKDHVSDSGLNVPGRNQ